MPEFNMDQIQPEEQDLLKANVRQVVGQSAMRKLSTLANDSKRDDINNTIFAKRMLCGFVFIFAAAVAVYLISPQSIIGILRTATASFH
jgi:hypothetical protein